jgi:hypothetical protein
VSARARRRGRDEQGNLARDPDNELDRQIRANDVEGLEVRTHAQTHTHTHTHTHAHAPFEWQVLRASCSYYGHELVVLGAGEPFGGFGTKIMFPLRHLQNLIAQRRLSGACALVYACV